MDVDPSPAGEKAPALSPLARVIGIFYRPVAVMEDLRRRPTSLLALLILIIGSNLAFAPVAMTFLDWQIDQAYEANDARPEDIDELVSFLDDHPAAIQVILHIGVTFQVMVVLLVWAGLYHLSASMFFQPPESRDPPGFRHAYAQAVHAGLVNIPAGFLLAGIVAVQGEFVQGLSLALLLPLDPLSAQYVAADWVSPFNFWWIGLLGVACAVNYRVPLGRALIVPIGVSLVFRIIQVLMASLGGGAG